MKNTSKSPKISKAIVKFGRNWISKSKQRLKTYWLHTMIIHHNSELYQIDKIDV